ncbi:MAG: hypothetical protein SangKO_066720 [Sandaracinaceae bacterium]
MSAKMALRRFTLQAAGGSRGRDAAESFARALLECFGLPATDGRRFSYSFPVVDAGKKTKRTVAAYWPERHVLADVVDRDAGLDFVVPMRAIKTATAPVEGLTLRFRGHGDE